MGGERPWLLLDLAGVLLDFVPERRLALIGSLSGLAVEEVKSRIEAGGMTERLDTGQADGTELARFLSELCNRPFDEAEAWHTWLSPFSVAPAAAALPALSQAYRLGVFTNNPRAITRLFDPTGFDAMFFSSDLGMKKPDPRSYGLVEAALGLPGRSLTFVDDGEANVEGARRAGWNASLYRGEGSEGLIRVLSG